MDESNFKDSTIEGDNFWMTKNELLTNKMVFSNTIETLDLIESSNIIYKEEHQKFEVI